MAASFSKSCYCRGSMTLLQITLKKKHKWVKATLTLSGKIPRIGQLIVVALTRDNHETPSQPIWDHWQIQGSWYLKGMLVGLLPFADIDNFFFLFCWHCVTCWGQIRSPTLWYRMQLLLHTHVNQVLMKFQTILWLAFNVEKGVN